MFKTYRALGTPLVLHYQATYELLYLESWGYNYIVQLLNDAHKDIGIINWMIQYLTHNGMWKPNIFQVTILITDLVQKKIALILLLLFLHL